MRIIDLSAHRPNLDLSILKGYGIEGVILRAGYGNAIKYDWQYDKTFEDYYNQAKQLGLHIGVYWYMYATDVIGCDDEMKSFEKIISGKQFDLPVFTDWEESKHVIIGKDKLTDLVRYCGNYLEARGYFYGFYCNTNFARTALNWDSLSDRFATWLADWTQRLDKNCPKFSIRQFTNKFLFKETGNTTFDCSRTNIDFPTIIKNGGFNGFAEWPKEKIVKIPNKEAEERFISFCSGAGITIE